MKNIPAITLLVATALVSASTVQASSGGASAEISSSRISSCSSIDQKIPTMPLGSRGFEASVKKTLAAGCAAYVATSSEPSALDLEFIRGSVAGKAVTIGTVRTTSGGVSLTDIALSRSGVLYGVDFTSDLYTINRVTGVAKLVGPVGFGTNGLVVSPTGVLYGSAGYYLLAINPATGAGKEIGLMGYASSGDLAFGSNGALYMSASESATGPTPSNWLVRVNTGTGVGTKVGPIGKSYVYGLAEGDGTLFATTLGGELLSINTRTGFATALATGGPSSNGMASPPPGAKAASDPGSATTK